MQRLWNSPSLLVGIKNETAILENKRQYHKKLSMHLPYDPATLFLGICPRKMKTFDHKKKVDESLKALFILIPTPNWKQPKCPSIEE